MQVVLYQFRISVMLALALLIWETKIKFDDNSSNDMQESQPFITLNAVISSVCLTVMLGMGARLLLCIWRGELRNGGYMRKQPVALNLPAPCQQMSDRLGHTALPAAAAAVRRIPALLSFQGAAAVIDPRCTSAHRTYTGLQ